MIESAILWMYAGFAVLLGLVFGSFANVLIARLPRDASLLTPSHCPRCGHVVRWIDLVPVLSWVWLRGRCRDCKSPISPLYPLIELLGGLLGYLLFARIFTGIADLDLPHVLAFIVLGAFELALLVAFFVDLRHQIIPDQTTTWMIPVGVLGTVALVLVGFDGFPVVSWEQSVLGAVVGGAGLGAVAVGYRLLTGTDGLGFGDAKLLAMIGSFLGAIPGVWIVMIYASVFGLLAHLVVIIVRRRAGYVPFGPSLAGAATLFVLYGDVITPLLLRPFAEAAGMVPIE